MKRINYISDSENRCSDCDQFLTIIRRGKITTEVCENPRCENPTEREL